MKKLFFAMLALSAFATGCKNDEKTSAADVATAANPPEKKMSPAEQQKAWMDYATPGAMHQWMSRTDGTWEGEFTSWPNPDSANVTSKSKGTAVYKTILGGRYQEGIHTGMMFGQPFEGRSLSGYDNKKKVFFSTWIDNMGSGIMYMEGTYDEKTKTLTSTGKMVDPSHSYDVDVKQVLTFVDDNTQQMAMYHKTADGKEVKDMEMIARRKK